MFFNYLGTPEAPFVQTTDDVPQVCEVDDELQAAEPHVTAVDGHVTAAALKLRISSAEKIEYVGLIYFVIFTPHFLLKYIILYKLK